MDLRSVINAASPPAPWAEETQIPWSDPDFSRRMLKEHLSQAHDAGSRRTEKIAAHVAWIHGELLGGRPARVLDIGCGPGLYTTALARLGHSCRGIDISPASVEYAQTVAAREGLDAVHTPGDIRTTPFGEGYDLAMFIFGELNYFRREDAEALLRKAHAALKPGGQLLLEPDRFEAVKESGTAARSWRRVEAGPFAGEPYLFLTESFWDEGARVAIDRLWVLTETGVRVMGSSIAAYTDVEYRALLGRCGFTDVQLMDNLGGVHQDSLMAITAVRT